MKTLGSITLLILTFLILPLTLHSAGTDEAKKVIGLILEKTDTGDFVQIGDYMVSDIETVVIKDDGKADKIGSTKDFFIGALVIANLTQKGGNGIWGASTVALILGSNQDEALADLSEDELNFIRETQKSIGESEVQVTADKDEVIPPKPEDGKLRLENGVWVN